MSMKNPLTAAGIAPVTFRFVAQHSSSIIYVKMVSSLRINGILKRVRTTFVTMEKKYYIL